jgi:transposase InsO family protein
VISDEELTASRLRPPRWVVCRGGGGLDRLGIYPELIAPGSPQQNGAHERMHRALKADTTRPPTRLYTPSRRRWPKIVEPLV